MKTLILINTYYVLEMLNIIVFKDLQYQMFHIVYVDIQITMHPSIFYYSVQIKYLEFQMHPLLYHFNRNIFVL